MLFFLWVQCYATFLLLPLATDLIEVVDCTSMLLTCLSICQASSGQMNGTTVLASLFYGCILVYSHSYISFCLCTLFLVNILSKCFVSFRFSRMADCPFVSQLFLPMPGLYHLSCYYSLLMFCGLFYYFYTHVTVIQPMYKLPLLTTYWILCSYILWWLFYHLPIHSSALFICLSAQLMELQWFDCFIILRFEFVI